MAMNKNAEPFYSIVGKGLGGKSDGKHFWDTVFEFLYNIPGFTNKIEGRNAYMDWFEKYPNVLHSADNLRVYKSADPNNVIILEYEVHGTVPSTGKAYDNRFVPLLRLRIEK